TRRHMRNDGWIRRIPRWLQHGWSLLYPCTGELPRLRPGPEVDLDGSVKGSNAPVVRAVVDRRRRRVLRAVDRDVDRHVVGEVLVRADLKLVLRGARHRTP